MQHAAVVEQLKSYIAQNVLDGEDIGLDETTPLLEWGVMNSLEIVRIIAFIDEHFHVEVPAERLDADSFSNLNAIANLILELQSEYQHQHIG
jgi:acyl carrier protein